MVRKPLIKIVLFCLAILSTSLTTVYAQEPDEGTEPIIIAPSGQINLTFEQLGYETRSLTRGESNRVYDINLPGNFQFLPTGNFLNLVTSHFPEVPEKPSLLQVAVNRQLVSTSVLTATNAVSNTIRLELPEGLLETGRNFISISLDTGGTCEEPGAFLDVLVGSDSALSIGYQQIPYPAELAFYPFPFTETSLLNLPVTIVLPDQPTSDDLSAAATLSAGLGQNSGGAINLSTVLISDLTPEIRDNSHLIVIGQPDTNALINDLVLPLPIDQTVLKPGQGILQEIVSPWNEFRLILVVSGLDGEGVLKASNALNRQAHFLGMKGPVAIVIDLGPLPSSATRRRPSFTLASLNYDDRVIYGTSPQNFRYDFDLPLNWQLEEPPFIVLKFAHANLISPDSALDIQLNRVPIGSTLLDDSNTDDGELIVSLPARLLETGRNLLDVSVEMRLSNVDRCAGLGNQRAWTVISNESELFLPYTAIASSPELGLFPYPFSQDYGLEPTSFVMPNQPSAQLINELTQFAARIGSASRTEQVSVQVRFTSDVDQDIRDNNHLILLGRPTENSLITEINANLPQPFVAGSDLPEPLAIDSVAFLPSPDRDAGFLEIIPSPWNEKFTVLAVTGTTNEGVALAAQALLNYTRRLEGNLAVVESIFNPFSEQPEQISTYSVDTRPIPSRQSESSIGLDSPEDLANLASRWWK